MTADPLTIGSLFAGIGGLELGLERGIGNGAHTVWQVEQNAYCRAVLAKHWPDATRYEDVRDVGRRNLAPVDVICGGFPCQDISDAGLGAGIDGERSGLWSEYARIVRELRPSYVVVENVAALTRRGLGRVLGDLAGLGYDAEWSLLSARDVGAPHRRDRLFVLAYPADVFRNGRSHHTGGRGSRALSLSESGNRHRAPDARCGWWVREPGVRPVAHGIPAPVDENGAIGNAVVPQVAEVVGRLIAAREAERADAA